VAQPDFQEGNIITGRLFASAGDQFLHDRTGGQPFEEI
jgi:hypothetical protein